MKTLILTLTIIFLSSDISKSQSGWFALSNPTIQPYFGVYFVNASTGFICGAGVIIRTRNGGVTWDSTSFEFSPLFFSIQFVNQSKGFAASAYGEIWRTENGGDNWVRTTPMNGGMLIYDIDFIDQNTGIAVGRTGVTLDSALIMRTNNGGDNWFTFPCQFIPILRGVSFYNGFDGFAVGEGSLRIKSINSGQNWSQTSGGQPNLLFDVYAMSSTTVYACGPGGSYISTNAGNSWSFLYPTGYTNKILFLDNSTGYCGSRDGQIWKTTNAGSLFVLQRENLAEEISDIYFVDNNTGYAVGNANNQGIIYKTTNGGASVGIQNLSSQIPEKYFLHQNYPNPFNPQTKIKFEISGLSDIEFKIFDLTGKEVYKEKKMDAPAGSYEFIFDNSQMNLPSGVYYYKLTAGNYRSVLKMVILK